MTKWMWRMEVSEIPTTTRKKMQQYHPISKIHDKEIDLIEILKTLKRKNIIDMKSYSKLKEDASKINKKLKGNREDIEVLIKNSPMFRSFMLTLYYLSVPAYEYVRLKFNNSLPAPRYVSRWYASKNAEPGFTEESFDALERKSKSKNTSLICSLNFDVLSLDQKDSFNGKEYLGALNYGIGSYEGDDTASDSLVFMVVSLEEEWKIPVGYFLTNHVPSDRKATLIKTCITKCHDAGVNIVSCMFGANVPMIPTANILGCKLSECANLKTHFPHPVTGDRIVVFQDTCIMIRSIRYAFEQKKTMYDCENRAIKWALLKNLNNLQGNDKLDFAKNNTARYINFRGKMMKAKLATHLLSMSIVEALDLCDSLLKTSLSEEALGVVHFIKGMNNLYDILNSTELCNYGFKQPLRPENKEKIFDFLEKAKLYILSLKFHQKTKHVTKTKNTTPRTIVTIVRKSMVESDFKTGFLGLLICIESLKSLYTDMVETNKSLKCIATHKLSHDNLERFFSCVRRHADFKFVSTAVQFRRAYKEVLKHMELRSTFTAYSSPCDNFIISHASSTNVINCTVAQYRHLYDEDMHNHTSLDKKLASDHDSENKSIELADMLNRNSTDAANLIVGCISGWVSRSLTKSIKCETCIESLMSPEKQWFHQIITVRDMGGFCYPSKDVYDVCMTTERLISKLLKESGSKTISRNLSSDYITTKSLKCFLNSNIFDCLSQHAYQQPATFNHRLHLMRAVIKKYTQIRLHRFMRNNTLFGSSRYSKPKYTYATNWFVR